MADQKAKKERCGCCGRACLGEWCKRCAKHINPKKTFWDATYLAQHGEHCPYQRNDLRLELKLVGG